MNEYALAYNNRCLELWSSRTTLLPILPSSSCWRYVAVKGWKSVHIRNKGNKGRGGRGKKKSSEKSVRNL